MMIKFLNTNAVFLSILIVSSFMMMGFGCSSSSGGGNKTKIQGVIQEVIQGSVSGITVRILENGKSKDRDTTNQLGEFKLNFTPNSDLLTLEFDGPDFLLSRVISVTRNSNIVMAIVLQLDPPLISFTNWTVLQDPIRGGDFDQITFNEKEAVFRIDGNNSNCIRANSESRVEITAKSISLIDCQEGITTQSFGLVILEADEDINVIAKKDGIRTKDSSFVRVARTMNPINNNISISSTKENGIRASGASQVIVDPQNNCVISGAKDAIRQSGTSIVNPSSCTLAVGN